MNFCTVLSKQSKENERFSMEDGLKLNNRFRGEETRRNIFCAQRTTFRRRAPQTIFACCNERTEPYSNQKCVFCPFLFFWSNFFLHWSFFFLLQKLLQWTMGARVRGGRTNPPTHCTISYHLWKRCCQLLNILYIDLSSEIIW